MKDIFFILMIRKQTKVKLLQRKDISFTLNVWKQTGGKISQIKDIFFFYWTSRLCKEAPAEILQMKEIFFFISGMTTNRWLNFTDKRHIFCTNE